MKSFKKVFLDFFVCVLLASQFILYVIPNQARANTWFELGIGANQAQGSDLEPNTHLGYRALVAWGAHLTWMAKNDALYLYASLDYDHLIQKGALELGSPTLSRQLLTPSLGLRYYRALENNLRLWAGLGLGQTYDQSSVKFIGLSQSNNYDSSSGIFNVELGLQYKITAGQLLGLSYSHIRLSRPEAMSLAERGLQIGRQDSMNAWQRLQLSWGFYI